MLTVTRGPRTVQSALQCGQTGARSDGGVVRRSPCEAMSFRLDRFDFFTDVSCRIKASAYLPASEQKSSVLAVILQRLGLGDLCGGVAGLLR